MHFVQRLNSSSSLGSRRHWLAAVLVGLGSLSTTASWAQAYPNKPIRLIIPYSTGTTTDVFGRLYALKLGEQLGQTIVTENRVGAGGNIAAEATARAAPDGYTLTLSTSATGGTFKLLGNACPCPTNNLRAINGTAPAATEPAAPET